MFGLSSKSSQLEKSSYIKRGVKLYCQISTINPRYTQILDRAVCMRKTSPLPSPKPPKCVFNGRNIFVFSLPILAFFLLNDIFFPLTHSSATAPPNTVHNCPLNMKGGIHSSDITAEIGARTKIMNASVEPSKVRPQRHDANNNSSEW